MYLPNPTQVFVKHIFYLSNFCSYEQFFEAWFVIIDNANVVSICESTELWRSFCHLRDELFIKRIDGPPQSLHVAGKDQTNLRH